MKYKFKATVLTSKHLGVLAVAIMPSPSATGFAIVFTAPGKNRDEALANLSRKVEHFVNEAQLTSIEETELEVELKSPPN
jgi:hypothetical protein